MGGLGRCLKVLRYRVRWACSGELDPTCGCLHEVRCRLAQPRRGLGALYPRLRWAFSNAQEPACACLHEPCCYLSGFVYDENSGEHVPAGLSAQLGVAIASPGGEGEQGPE